MASAYGFGKGYDHVNDAAAAALMLVARLPRAQQQEYMALLFQDPNDEKIYRTGFKTSGKRDKVLAKDATFRIPKGSNRGAVHNHPIERPGDHPTTDFSEPDINSAKAFKELSFIAATQPGGPMSAKNRVFRPGQTPVQRMRGTAGQPFATGERFLAQFPIEEFKQVLMRKILQRMPNDRRGLRR